MFLFNEEARRGLRTLIRESPVDHAACVSDTRLVVRQWLTRFWPDSDTAFLQKVLEYKLAGYNAEVHAWSIRLHRAVVAADHFLRNFRSLHFELPTLQIGEYFVLARAKHLGIEVTCEQRWEDLLSELRSHITPAYLRPDYESIEVVLPGGPIGGSPTTEQCEHKFEACRGGTIFLATMETYLPPLVSVLRKLLSDAKPAALIIPQRLLISPTLHGVSPEALITIEAMTAQFGDIAAPPPDWLGHAPQTQATQMQTTQMQAPDVDCATVSGVSLWPFIGRDLHSATAVYAPYVRRLRVMFETVLSRYNIRHAVCARLRRATELTFMHAAKGVGCRTTMILHGHISSQPVRTFVDGDFKTPDAVLVWGKPQRDIAMIKGVAPAKITVTGNPAWECPGAFIDRQPLLSMRARLNIEAARAIVTFIGQPDAAPQYEEVFRAVAAVDGLALLFRPHPSENPQSVAELAARSGGRVVIVTESSTPWSFTAGLNELISSSDCVITLHSSVNLQSLAMGVPVATVAIGSLAREEQFVCLDLYGLPVIHTPEQLRKLLTAISSDPTAWGDSMAAAVDAARADWGMIDGMHPASRAAQSIIKGCEATIGSGQSNISTPAGPNGEMSINASASDPRGRVDRKSPTPWVPS